MGLLDSFRPKFKHSNSEIREKAVMELTDEKILTEIAKNDENEWVRKAAVENPNLKNEKILIEIAKNDKSEYVRYSAIDKISDQEFLSKIASKPGFKSFSHEYHDGLHAVKNPNLTDNQLLSNIIKNTEDKLVIESVPEKITDENILIKLYHEFKDDEDLKTIYKRKFIVLEITDKDLLIDIAKNDNNKDVRKNAIASLRLNYPELMIDKEELDNIRDEDKLIDIAKNNLDMEIRALAVGRVSNEKALIDIIKTDTDNEVVDEAVKNPNLTNQKILSEIASDFKYSKYSYISRLNAIAKLKDGKLLSKIALEDKEAQLRYVAVENPNLKSESVLKQIARSDDVWHTRNEDDKDVDYYMADIAKQRLK